MDLTIQNEIDGIEELTNKLYEKITCDILDVPTLNKFLTISYLQGRRDLMIESTDVFADGIDAHTKCIAGLIK